MSIKKVFSLQGAEAVEAAGAAGGPALDAWVCGGVFWYLAGACGGASQDGQGCWEGRAEADQITDRTLFGDVGGACLGGSKVNPGNHFI